MKTATTTQEVLNKTKSHAFGKDIYLLGSDSDRTKYWLEAPKWDCGWYWGFGYVETYTNNENPDKSRDINSHQHIDTSFMGKSEYYDHEKGCFRQGEYIHNIYDSPKLAAKTFTEKEGWELSELFKQFYFLREAAENFGRGKCHTADTKINTWKRPELVKEINEKLIPEVTARIIEILSPTE